MRLVVTATKQGGVYLTGEPVTVRVELRNEGTRPEMVRVPLSGATQNVTYSISSDGHNYTVLLPSAVMDYAGAPVELAPSKSVHHDETLRHNEAGTDFLFREPGQYFLRVKWNGPADQKGVESQALMLTVVRPLGFDATAFTRLDAPEARRAFIGLAVPTPQALSALEGIASEPSAYAPHVALMLGEREFGESDTDQAARERRLERALQWLAKADREGFPLRSRVLHLQSRAFVMLGEIDRANAVIERLTREFPDSPEASGAVPYRETENDRLARLSRAPRRGPRQEVDPAVRREVRDVLSQFLRTLEAGDLKPLDSLLADEFMRDGVLNKQQMIEELQEDLDKLKGASLKVETSEPSFEREGEDVVVAFTVGFTSGGQAGERNEHAVRLKMRKYGAQWRIQRWDGIDAEQESQDPRP
jgi:hypothetical protein